MGLEARSVSRLFAWAFAIAGCAAVVAAQSDTVAWPHAANRVDPKEFGIQDETITVVSGLSFVPRIPNEESETTYYFISPSLAIYCKCFDISQLYEWYAAVAIPPGAVLGYIGVNSMTTVDGVLGAALWERDRDGTLTFRYGFSLPAHNHFNTDLAGPLGIQVPSNLDREYVLYRSSVFPVHRGSTAAAGITAGCGGGNFCPDQPITRKQEAAFIAKALGLHWPN